MALVITSQTLIDSPVETHLKLNFGGTSGDLTDTTIFDPANFLNPTTSNKLLYVRGAVCGFFVYLNWDGATDAPLLSFGDSSNFFAHDFNHNFGEAKFSGILNNAITPTGKILLTSNGFGGAPTETGWLVLGIRKREIPIIR